MTCYHPLDGFRVVGGKVAVVARGDRAPHNAITRVAFPIPCGQCVGCRMEKARQWAMRCSHESRLHKKNSFITLTYHDKFLPPGGSLSPTAFKLFLQRLRYAREEKVRYYACGEYGDYNARPHYHAILFNCDFPDRRFHKENKRGERLYYSPELEKLWPYGFNIVGDVSFDSSSYVARYILKKISGEKAEDHYAVIDGDGVVYDRVPEFARMSRMPGIGTGYYEKYGNEVRAHDTIIVNARKVKPPRFYDVLTERLHKARYDQLKRKRKALGVKNRNDNTPERLRVKEEIALRTLKEKKKEL